MKTVRCRRLFDYWNERRGSRAAPERGDLEPGAIRQLLADSFIVAADGGDGHVLRLAGTRMCALFCREIKDTPIEALFASADRDELRDLIGIVTGEMAPVIAGASARPDVDTPAADFELLLLPLYYRGRHDARLLGMLAPVSVPYWLGTSAVATLSLGHWRHLGRNLRTVGDPTLPPRRAGENLRRLWVVLDGGRR